MTMTAESGAPDVPTTGTRLILPTLVERTDKPAALVTPNGGQLPLSTSDEQKPSELDLSIVSVPDIEEPKTPAKAEGAPPDDATEPAEPAETTDSAAEAGADGVSAAGTTTVLALAKEEPSPTATTAAEDDTVFKFRIFSLIDPDRRWVMIVAMVLMTGVLAANLITSFTNVYAMAAWIGVPVEVQWLPVVILDVAIVAFSWGLMVFKSRGAPVLRTRFYIGVVTAFSVVANFMHTYDHWHGDLTSPQAITGISLSAAIPLMSLVITEELIRLVFKIRDRRKHTVEIDK